jgi:hypothetical protein
MRLFVWPVQGDAQNKKQMTSMASDLGQCLLILST